MKFTKIRLKSNNLLELPIVGINHTDPYILKKAEGLGPPEIDLFISKPRHGKGYYRGRNVRGREVVLLIALNPDYNAGATVSDLRENLYTFLSPGLSEAIEIIIVNEDQEIMHTFGYFQKLEVVPFTSEPLVQLVFSCPDSYFYALTGKHADLTQGTNANVVNQGSAESGFKFELKFNQNTSPFSILNQRQKGMTFLYDFALNDILRVDTRVGLKSITVERRDIVTNIEHVLSSDSQWLTLYSGTNEFTFSSAAFSWIDFYYIPSFWGI